jgi:hypothetical protein
MMIFVYNTHIQYIYIYTKNIYIYLHDHINMSWLNYLKSPIYGRFFPWNTKTLPDLVCTWDPASSCKAALQKLFLSRGIGFLRGFISKETMGNLWETYGKPMGNTWGTHGKHMGNTWENQFAIAR